MNTHGGPRPAIRQNDKRLNPNKKKRVTISLKPHLIEQLKGENKNRLIEKLLVEYFERIEKCTL